jgi:RNA polymerase sigma factor (TIGR02999 family)
MTAGITVLLRRMREGDAAAGDELMPLVYRELHRIAQAFMRRQQPGHTLQPTALVNEAFIKFVESDQCALADRAHFLALMSRVMRQVLVDHARAIGAAKRGGGEAAVPWDSRVDIASGDNARELLQLLDLHDALDALAAEDPSLAQVVEMYYFGGMTAEETAVAVNRSAHAVRHDLRLARAWLRRKLAGPS